MLIDRIYQKVKTFVNTEIRGNVTPAEFNLFLHDAIQSRIEEYVFDINRAQNRENRGLGTHFMANVPDRLYEKVSHYIVTDTITSVTASEKTLPNDVLYIDEIENDTGETYEVCRNKKEFNIAKPFVRSDYPVCYRSGNTLNIFPAHAGPMNVTYWRQPNIPKWTYNVVSGAELFNPSKPDFVDADIHPSEEDEIVRRVLMRFGINLKEQDITAFTMQDESKEFSENNAT